LEAKIVLRYRDPRQAEAVAKSVSPDNVKVPPYLSVETVTLGKEVITYIRCEESRLRTFISTIDDLLRCVSVAEKAFSAITKLSA